VDSRARVCTRSARQGSGCAQDEIGLVGRKAFRERAADLQTQLPGGRRRQPVAVAAKGEQRFDAVVPVGQPFADVQSKVDLGVGGFGQFGSHGAALAGVMPMSSLARSRAASSSSACSSAALHA
jgi:hypothetical protein